MRSPFLSIADLSRFALTAAIGFSLDLWTKSLAFSRFADWNPISTPGSMDHDGYAFLPGWLEFEAVRNRGAVFGWGQGQRALFVVVSIGAIAFLALLFSRSSRKWFYQIILGMLLAGVLGNMYDRIVLGYVRDMIHALPRWPNLFPYVFNVADTLLCTGVGLMILHGLFTKTPRDQAQPSPDVA